MKLLYAVPWPPQGIYVNKEIASVADMRGLKWRAYSPATAKIAELIGAQPVTIQAAELSQALATGVVNSYMSSGSTGYDSKTYESIKYWYDTQAWLPKNGVLVNQAAFSTLDAPTQQAVLKAAADAEARGWKLSQEKNDWYKKALTEKGMKIMAPPPKLMADMRQVGAIMVADWEKKAGPDGTAVIANFRKQ
jgi:TRAP-type C4-dicarboxylate transport system substrate-binding protein